MKFGIVLSSNDAEVVWNAFRLGNTALKEGIKVKVFLINKGVESESIESKEFNIKEQINAFVENKGKILACGTCLKSRQKEGNKTCPISTMKDLLELIQESNRIVSFS